MKVLVDTNVIVDVLQRREPMFFFGQEIFRAVASKQIEGFITTKQAADIHFFARKQFKGQTDVDAKARDVMGRLFSLFGLVDTLGIDCQAALHIRNNDYEDAMMIAGALRFGVDCIVTRDAKHFRNILLPVYAPDEFAGRFLRQ